MGKLIEDGLTAPGFIKDLLGFRSKPSLLGLKPRMPSTSLSSPALLPPSCRPAEAELFVNPSAKRFACWSERQDAVLNQRRAFVPCRSRHSQLARLSRRRRWSS